MSVSISFIRRAAVLSALSLGLFFSAACDGDNCIDGTQCTCDDDVCEDVCESDSQGGCQFTCSGDSCKNSCPGGGCQMTCSSKSCELDCPGGSCQLTCAAGAESCVMTGCTTGCELTCNGAATCQNSCDVLGGCVTTP